MKVKDFTEHPKLFKVKGKNYMSTDQTAVSDMFRYCVNLADGSAVQMPQDAEAEKSDFYIVNGKTGEVLISPVVG